VRDPLKLLEQGYDAVCLATGISTRDHSLGVEGEEAEGVLSAATFLRKINLGEPIQVGRRVAVVGGGITALDAAAVARRLGAEEVHLVLDRPRGELPAYHWEMAAVESEGIRLHEHTAAARILAADGKVNGVELARTGKGMTVDERGRRRPKLEPGTEFTLAVDTVIATVGQQSDLTFLDPVYDDLIGDTQTLASEYPGLFVVGGRKTGASYIIEAVGLGHRVAASIHRFLQKQPLAAPERPAPPVVKITREQLDEQVRAGTVSMQPRQEPALIPLDERVTSFREVVLPLTERQARIEAQRCLQCGLCSECLACTYACGVDAIDHEMVEREEKIQVGAVILAPGYQAYRAELTAEYGLGRYPNVVTALQLERMLNASGPTRGRVQRPSDGQAPLRVAFLQCVGSRDQSHDYCSAVCCMYATKEAMLLKDHHPETAVQVFMMDVRAYSKGYAAYYQRAREQHGIQYTRCRISGLREQPGTGNLLVRYLPERPAEFGQDGGPALHAAMVEQPFDLVVLSVGMEISEPVRQLARDLQVEIDDYGFCHTVPFRPVETSRAGIFAVGPFREPKDIPESVVDASGAAGLASGLLAPVRGALARHVEYPPERDLTGEAPRVGVFVCHCGSNIAGHLDVEQVTAYASGLPHVIHAEHLLYACSQDSTALIQDRIREHGLNRAVVASCTPLTHGPLFQDCLRQVGLNEHLLAMANIRNHCSWVHSDDRQLATAKAKELVRMALARAVGLEPLQRGTVSLERAALVVGGGPAGMNAALTLAGQGYPVHLVEREPELGGNLRRLFYGLGPGEPAGQPDPQTYLTELAGSVHNHPHIRVHLGAEVTQSHGFVGNFETQLREADGSSAHIRHGVTILATGGQEYRGPDYGYGSHPGVLTQQEFEAWLVGRPVRPGVPPADPGGVQPEAESPDSGERSRRLPDPASVRQVVMLQCVGPAEGTCTRTCCAVALKNAVRFKGEHPAAQVVVLYRDIRTYGFLERLYTQARQLGVLFLRYEPDHKPVVEAEDPQAPLHVQVQDPSLGTTLTLQPDLLVLSMPMVPAHGSRELATRFKVPVDMDGWFLEAHIKLRPVEFASEGIFLAGAAHYPKLLEESIVQAQAAASRAATVLAQESLAARGAIAQVDPTLCVGCLTCVRVCPYGVPAITADLSGVGGVMGAAYIEPTICQGCGTCASECPAQAIELLHYRHHQVERQALALFGEQVLRQVEP
jgi:heterodisulfide reductase subunit A-like polyferredoxin